MKIVIEDLRPWDGSYDFTIDEFSRREWGWIKRLAGYLPGDVEKGFAGADPELYAVFGVIALYRSARIGPDEAADIFERFLDGGKIRLEGTKSEEKGDDASPPAESSNGNETSSGADSSKSSETSPPTRPDPGHPFSGTSESPQIASVT